MDPEALALQERLHRDNQQRLERMEDRQVQQVDAIARIEENTRHLPDLHERVDALEKHRDQQTGALGVLNRFGGLLGVVVGAGLEWLLRHVWSK